MTPRRLTTQDVKAAVCAQFKVPLDAMTSARRNRAVARPRQVAMYLTRKMVGRSTLDIGHRFGGRDHTTVIHALRQIEKLRAIDADLDADITAVERALG